MRRSDYRTIEEIQARIKNSTLAWSAHDNVFKIRLNHRLLAVIGYCASNDKYAVMTVHNGKGNSKFKSVDAYYENEMKEQSYERTQQLLASLA